jgi:quercetin dioxygenase-like cupin family protein
MKRKSFMQKVLAAATMPFFSSVANGKSGREQKPGKTFKVEAGKDRFDNPIELYEGDAFYCKVSGKDTNGNLYIYESTRAKKGGPAQHFHYDQDEWFFIMEGEFVIKVGDTTYSAKAGDSIFAPRKIPHVWAKTNDGPGKMMITFQPAGKMEEYFHAVSQGKLAKMTEEEQNGFRKTHGFERVGPALGYHKQ